MQSQTAVQAGQRPANPNRRQGRRSLGATLALGVVSGAAIALSTVSGAHAQDEQSAVDRFRMVLQQTADTRTTTLQRQFYVDQQAAEIARLESQLAASQSDEQQAMLMPMLRDMVGQLETVMVEDLPFRVEARFATLDNLRENIANDEADVYDGFRRAFELAEDEVAFGLSVQSYTGNNPVNPGRRFEACQADPLSPACDLSDDQKLAIENGMAVEDFNQLGTLPDGNYIHYGRVALLYLERDSSEGYRYDADSKQWEPLTNSQLLGLRQNVRIARGESAISTMTVPVTVPGGSSADDSS